MMPTIFCITLGDRTMDLEQLQDEIMQQYGSGLDSGFDAGYAAGYKVAMRRFAQTFRELSLIEI